MVRSLIVLAALMAVASPASAQTASLYFDSQTPSGVVPVGSTFTVAVKADLSSVILGGVDFSVTWDPAVLSLEGRELGDFWGSSPFDVSDWLEASPGWAYFGCVEFSSYVPPDGTWTVVTYTFRVVGPGTTALTFGPGTLTVPGFVDNVSADEFPASPVVNGAYPTYDVPTILSASAPSSATVGNLVTLSATVLNPLGASSITVEFWSGSTTLLGTVTHTVGGGTTQAFTLGWNTTAFAPGSHPVRARLQGTSIDVPAGTIVLGMPSVPSVSAPSSGGSSGGGGGGCSAGGASGNFIALAGALAVLLVARLR